MLNYIGFTIVQLSILRFQKHRSGWGVKIPRPRYLAPGPVFLTDCAISYQDHLKKANI